jgi:hypothetical protein
VKHTCVAVGWAGKPFSVWYLRVKRKRLASAVVANMTRSRAASGRSGTRKANLACGAVLGTSAALTACDARIQADHGADALMQVEAAEFVRGALPPDGAGPSVESFALTTNKVRIGGVNHPIAGALGPSATAASIALDGDVGYWIVPAGAPDVQSPLNPTFRATASFSRLLTPGAHSLSVRAVDGAGRLGVATAQPIDAIASGGSSGQLVVTLTWDTESDLDLHVVDPTGVEIYKGNINSYAPPGPGQPADPTAWERGGLLDVDSNAACVIDGLRAEHVTWKSAPPSGHYVVRVDTFSLCAAADAHWTVAVALAGGPLARSSGVSLPSDTRFSHDRGAGVVAAEFDVP